MTELVYRAGQIGCVIKETEKNFIVNVAIGWPDPAFRVVSMKEHWPKERCLRITPENERDVSLVLVAEREMRQKVHSLQETYRALVTEKLEPWMAKQRGA